MSALIDRSMKDIVWSSNMMIFVCPSQARKSLEQVYVESEHDVRHRAYHESMSCNIS